jgi:RimJ/RimL family protein N-acetyltransferase
VTERTANSGSWLARAFHGRGIGTEMPAALLALAFDGLGAHCATTGAFEDDPASARVSQKLGYAETGIQIVTVRDAPVRERRFELTREAWARDTRRARPAEIEGLEQLPAAVRGLRVRQGR